MKYAPQLGIDKDIAGAYVIGRRALGFKENIPKNYLKLLADKEYLDYALHCYKKKEEELTQTLSNETNRYKKKAVNSDLEKIKRDRSLLLESLQIEPSSCEGAKGRNPKQGLGKPSQSAWRVLKVAFLFPVLGDFMLRNLSPLKPVLVKGAWNRVRSRLVPLEVGVATPT